MDQARCSARPLTSSTLIGTLEVLGRQHETTPATESHLLSNIEQHERELRRCSEFEPHDHRSLYVRHPCRIEELRRSARPPAPVAPSVRGPQQPGTSRGRREHENGGRSRTRRPSTVEPVATGRMRRVTRRHPAKIPRASREMPTSAACRSVSGRVAHVV
jgi:hypothetical protein